jgi:hypothetical protein
MKLNKVKGAWGEDLSGADIYIVMMVILLAVSTIAMIQFNA